MKKFNKKELQKYTWPIVPITIIGGIIYPLLGAIVLIVMLTGIIGGIVKKKRFTCSWLCPRGAFYDRIVKHISPKRKIPAIFRNKIFKWSIFFILIGFMTYQISLDPGNIYHWGRVLIRICLITTGIGLILAVIYHHRTWCTFCPIGHFQSSMSYFKKREENPEKECNKSESCKTCPLSN